VGLGDGGRQERPTYPGRSGESTTPASASCRIARAFASPAPDTVDARTDALVTEGAESVVSPGRR
jgi:hypothetical protein